jgi:hypothetical protein
LAQLGKIEQPRIRLVRRLPPGRVAARDRLVFCPFLDGPDPAALFWLGGLAWQDANARLLASLHGAAPPRCTVYAGVFGVDPFRRDEDIFAALAAAGIQGVVNLPSVAFMDGELAAILGSFDLGAQREIALLRRARAYGLRIAGCAADADAADAMLQAGAELIIAHAGPPLPGRPDPGYAAATRLRRRYSAGPPVVSASELLATLS